MAFSLKVLSLKKRESDSSLKDISGSWRDEVSQNVGLGISVCQLLDLSLSPMGSKCPSVVNKNSLKCLFSGFSSSNSYKYGVHSLNTNLSKLGCTC